MNYKARIAVAEWVIQKAEAMYDMGKLSKEELNQTIRDGKRAIATIKFQQSLNQRL